MQLNIGLVQHAAGIGMQSVRGCAVSETEGVACLTHCQECQGCPQQGTPGGTGRTC